MWAVTLLAVLLGVGVPWMVTKSRDPSFRGIAESDWIRTLAYNNDDQVRQWREFGPEGVQVLIRGLDKAYHPAEILYRKVHRQLRRTLPQMVLAWLPAPRPDATRSARMKITYLLASLSKDAGAATPIMTRALDDEDAGVRQLAITFFTQGEDENALLNRLEPKRKLALLPRFLAAMQDTSWGVRNNAAVALRYYPERSETVSAILIKALNDPDPHVRLVAARSLHRVAPDRKVEAGPPGAEAAGLK